MLLDISAGVHGIGEAPIPKEHRDVTLTFLRAELIEHRRHITHRCRDSRRDYSSDRQFQSGGIFSIYNQPGSSLRVELNKRPIKSPNRRTFLRSKRSAFELA